MDYGSDQRTIPESAQFIDLTGRIPADKGVELAQYVAQCFENPSVLMVRNRVEVVLEDYATVNSADFEDLPSAISRELEGTEIQQLWNHYRGQIQC